MSTWFITGASRGFGTAIARAALAAGHSVAATGRSIAALADAFPDADGARLQLLELDVTDEVGVRRAVAAAAERFGSIDVLVNNAGRGLFGAVEEISDAETRALMETNFFGVLTVTRAVLPLMRAQRSGRIVVISSFGGFTQPGTGFGIYGASKFAVEGFHEALQHEVRELGITVTIVEPGSFRTDFLEQSSVGVAAAEIDDYTPVLGAGRARVREGGGAQPGDPAKAGAAIVAFVDAGETALRLPLGADALAAISAKLAAVSANLDCIRALNLSTDFD